MQKHMKLRYFFSGLLPYCTFYYQRIRKEAGLFTGSKIQRIPHLRQHCKHDKFMHTILSSSEVHFYDAEPLGSSLTSAPCHISFWICPFCSSTSGGLCTQSLNRVNNTYLELWRTFQRYMVNYSHLPLSHTWYGPEQ